MFGRGALRMTNQGQLKGLVTFLAASYDDSGQRGFLWTISCLMVSGYKVSQDEE